MIEFRMPSLGADMEDGKFVQWLVEPGQAVKRGDVICVIETQKGAVDVEVWDSGTVAKLLAEPEQRIAVGQTMAVLAGEGEDWRSVAKSETAAAEPAEAQQASRAAPAVAPVGERTGARAPSAGLRISPAARKRAEELGIDPASVAPARPGAPIGVVDVEKAATAARCAPAPAVQTSTPPPAVGMRAAIAAAMTRSKREIPHYYLGCEIDVEHAAACLEAFNKARPVSERVIFAALALKAVARALREVPVLNGYFVDGVFRRADAIHIGVVTALRGGGVIVPALHDADQLELPQLMATLNDLLTRVRAGQLRSSDLADATVTVTNLGDLGADTVYGVIYPPQVALIGLGRVSARPLVRDGALIAGRALNVTLAADHRVTDGMTGARYLAALRTQFENPEV